MSSLQRVCQREQMTSQEETQVVEIKAESREILMLRNLMMESSGLQKDIQGERMFSGLDASAKAKCASLLLREYH